MLPVIHSDENWKKNAPVCLHCGQLDIRTGLCFIGLDIQSHANSGYCPQQDFGPGSNVKPEVWPTEIDARIQTCRDCVAFAKNHCGNDGVSILAHARQGICPMGNYGAMGTIQTPQASPGATTTSAGGGCCG